MLFVGRSRFLQRGQFICIQLDFEHFFDTVRAKHNRGANIDILDLIKIEGSPSLRARIRTLLENYRSLFATTFS